MNSSSPTPLLYHTHKYTQTQKYTHANTYTHGHPFKHANTDTAKEKDRGRDTGLETQT